MDAPAAAPLALEPQPGRSGWTRADWFFLVVAVFLIVAMIVIGLRDELHPVALTLSVTTGALGGLSGRLPVAVGIAISTLGGALAFGMPDQHVGAGTALLLPVVGCLIAGRKVACLLFSGWVFVLMTVQFLNHSDTVTVAGVAGATVLNAGVVGLALFAGSAIRSAQERRKADYHQAICRLRRDISRELHDTVAHELSVVTLRADHCRRAGAASSADLEIIATQSRRAVDDLRNILHLLRSTEPDKALAPVRPLSELIEDRVTELDPAGFPCQTTIDGDLGSLPRSVSDTLARVLQEAFNNVVRHGAPGRCTLLLSVTPTAAEFALTNPAQSKRAANPANRLGVIGMRERVEARGGNLSAGRLGQRWVVRAAIPLER